MTAREELADMLAEQRDGYPRRADDMDSEELADAILASDWLARLVAEVKAAAWAEGFEKHQEIHDCNGRSGDWTNPYRRTATPEGGK